MSGNYFCHICGGLVDLIKLQPSGVDFCNCKKQFSKLRAEINEQARLLGISSEKELALRAENERLKEELAAALASCEAKDVALVDIKMGLDIDEYEWGVAGNALAIQPDASALKAHDETLIDRCLDAVAVVANKYRDPNKADYNPEFGSWDEFEEVAAAIRELKRAIADGTSD